MRAATVSGEPGLSARAGRYRRAMRIAALACLMVGTTACQPGRGGDLAPVAGQIAGAPAPFGGSSVRLTAPGLEVDVSGTWQTRLEANSFEVQAVYRNTGRSAILLDAARFHAVRGADQGDVVQVVDMTGVDLADARDDNDTPKDVLNLFENRPTGTIRLAPGERRHLAVTTALPNDVPALDDGQPVGIAVPIARGTVTARFTTTSSWL